MLSGRDCNGSCTVRDMPDREEEACQKKIRLMKSDNSVKRGRGLVGVVEGVISFVSLRFYFPKISSIEYCQNCQDLQGFVGSAHTRPPE